MNLSITEVTKKQTKSCTGSYLEVKGVNLQTNKEGTVRLFSDLQDKWGMIEKNKSLEFVMEHKGKYWDVTDVKPITLPSPVKPDSGQLSPEEQEQIKRDYQEAIAKAPPQTPQQPIETPKPQSNIPIPPKTKEEQEKEYWQLSKCCEKIANQRRRFHHQVANGYIRDYGVIKVENLQIENMVKNHKLDRDTNGARNVKEGRADPSGDNVAGYCERSLRIPAL